MSYKEANQFFYDTHSQSSEAEEQHKVLRGRMSGDIDLFLASLPGKEILDLGSGPGRDSVLFRDRGLVPLCFDISPEMLKLCEKKGLVAMHGDLENIPFGPSSFDGVWAFASLLHIPKANLPPVLAKIGEILRPSGVFYLGMKEGDFEGFLKSPDYEGTRFFSLYNKTELDAAVGMYFKIVHHSRVLSKRDYFLNYLCKKLQTK